MKIKDSQFLDMYGYPDVSSSLRINTNGLVNNITICKFVSLIRISYYRY
jgi:hypothetical protein